MFIGKKRNIGEIIKYDNNMLSQLIFNCNVVDNTQQQ